MATKRGTSRANVLNGTAAPDLLYGEGGSDTLFGKGGADKLYGGAGGDFLDGGRGADFMDGGRGNDVFVVDDTRDRIRDSSGFDTVSTKVTYRLPSGIENIVLNGGGDIDGTGNAGNNVLLGNTGNNRLFGGDGNDFIDGGRGTDVLFGDAGFDSLAVHKFGEGDILDYNDAEDSLVVYTSEFSSDPEFFTLDTGLDLFSVQTRLGSDPSKGSPLTWSNQPTFQYLIETGALWYLGEFYYETPVLLAYLPTGIGSVVSPQLTQSDFIILA